MVLAMGLGNEASAQFSFEKHKALRKGEVGVYKLKKGKRNYGYATFLWRGRSKGKLKAKYFASGNTYKAFKDWRKGKNVVLISSGGYSTGFSHKSDPVGLCVDNGKIVNRRIENDKDALVIVEAVGGVRVSDIDKCDLSLGGGRPICPRGDKNKLLNWGVNKNATIFQTHLLAFKNTLRINPTKSSQKSTTRRFLVVGFREGELFHAIFNVDKEMTLYAAADNALKAMAKMNVIAIVNLDTGGNDIYEVYDDDKSKLRYMMGEAEPRDATNLLVYYYD
jgi:hypothetical protein